MNEFIEGLLSASTVAKRLSSIEEAVEDVGRRSAEVAAMDDNALAEAARSIRARESEQTQESAATETFALVREAARRALGLRPRDVQLVAAFALTRGWVAEMHTGEGKTLAAVHTACFHALSGRRTHILTVNDYLARRDAEWMGPVYRMLGVSVGTIVQGMSRDQRRASYACDVTYTTAKEAGFDFLRDSLAIDAADRVHAGLDVAIVDEADSILIDEARIPLVLAGRASLEAIDSTELAEVVSTLRGDVHYQVDREGRNVELTEAGLAAVEEALGTGDLYAANDPGLVADVANAVHALALLERDVDYLVREGKIELVDELTGRVADQRQWPDGLQAAIEAKEGVRVQPEGRILNSITMQHFVSQYRDMTGMTATATASIDELREFYDLEVLPVPHHRPCIRVDHPDRVLPTREAKNVAVLEEVLAVHATGQPIVVGTASVAESEKLAEELRAHGVECAVLNAKNDALEAGIVAEAGGQGAVTISTNMAGRGTDIRLGGKSERSRDAVVALGGLYVLGTNRHESRRVDDQLRGRAGRQGDPGSSRFFTSLEDDLVARYAAITLDARLVDTAIVRREIDRAQRIADGQNFETRKSLFLYAALIDRHRQLIYDWRDVLVSGARQSATAEPGPWASDWLAEACPARRRELAAELGDEAVSAVEQEICLRVIDHAWGDHLARLSELRTSAHLNRYAGRPPLDVFRREGADAFDALIQSIESESMRVFEQAHIDANGVDWQREGLETPSSTWTYTINDQLIQSNQLLSFAYNPVMVFYAGFAAPFLLIYSLLHKLVRAARRR